MHQIGDVTLTHADMCNKTKKSHSSVHKIDNNNNNDDDDGTSRSTSSSTTSSVDSSDSNNVKTVSSTLRKRNRTNAT